MAQRKEPTEKQKRQALEFIKTGNLTRSVMKHYNTDSPQVAYKIGRENLRNPVIKSFIETTLNKVGLTDIQVSDYLRKIIVGGLSQRAMRRVSPADSLRGIEMAFRLRDRFPAQKAELTKRELSVRLEGRTEEDLASLLDEQAKELKKWQRLLKVTKTKAINGEIEGGHTPDS